MTPSYDIAVVGGGILGCATALRLSEGGMRAIVIERGDLGQGASGVNAGTLSLQIKRVKLMPYALEGHRRWAALGDAVGYRETGGYTLAFNEREANLLHERMALKAEAGAPIEFVAPSDLAKREPGLCQQVVAASWCAKDGYANSSLTGRYYRARLLAAQIPYREHSAVTAIEPFEQGFTLRTSHGEVSSRRLLLACGGWLQDVTKMLGVDLPVRARINTVSVTERGPRLVNTVVGHATGLLTLKQKANGTVLIGGGWQGQGSPREGRGRIDLGTLVPNLALAQYAVPGLRRLRILRSWTGFEANVPDFYPLAGALPGVPGAFVLGCVRGGYTIGPYISELMGDFILGREPERPLFDPARVFEATT
ncbi:FAD-binding oxidoreductase [Pelagibius sp. CAU 1746]|uniref:NAD(P)/FAD-dependent oxidoreductase n=1 Tax=Pelagibius sp. CAU 1746 TaxID=3140370 RepID=UPI00325B99D9